MNQTTNIAALLQMLNPGQQQQAQQPPQAPMQQAQQPSAGGLEAIFSQFRNSTAPAPVPQAQSSIDPSIQQALNLFNQQQQVQPQMPYQPPPPAVPQQQATPDLSNILARITQNQAPQQPQQQPQEGMYGYQDQQQQQQDSRKRPWSDGGGNQQYEQSNDYKRGKGFQGKKVRIS